MEYANIVEGGESYGTITNYYIGTQKPTTKDNTITNYMFAHLNPIRKVILPKSIIAFDGDRQFVKTQVDTLIINGSMSGIGIGGGYDNKFWGVHCIYLPEGIKSIYFEYLFHSYALKNVELFLPSTLGKVDGRSACIDETAIFHCSSLRPDTIRVIGYTNNKYAFFNNGTIYVPKGTKDLYKNSIFSKLNIIEDIHVEGLSLDERKIAYVGDVIELHANIIPSDAINTNLKWVSSNPEVATISSDGILSALSSGSLDIIATTVDGGFTATCRIEVFDHTVGIEIPQQLAVSIGQAYNLNAQTLPLSTSDGKITYSCDDKSIATVSETGVVKGKAKGTCTITATTVDGGFTATCDVTVLQPVEAATLETHGMEMKVGDNKDLYCNLQPATADNKAIVWQSSDENIATVDNSGSVTALKAGTVYIRAISEDNPEAKDSCKVTVLQPVKGITLNYSTYEVNAIGESFVLEATISPEDASNKEIKWTSSDESVCIVSNGTVVVTGFGTCVIIASTNDGNFIATCTINSVSTGIKTINSEDASFDVYGINGVSRKTLRKGMNIIRMSDGSVKKVVVK